MLKELYADIKDGYIAAVTLSPAPTVKWFGMDELGSCEEYMLALSRQFNVYFNHSVAGRIPAKGRGRIDDFHASPGVPLDFDIKQVDNVAHAANEHLPPSLEAIFLLLAGC
jgi:hypothetical protein